MSIVNEDILKKLHKKIQDMKLHEDESSQLIKSLSSVDNSESFALGIVVGRLYNTFFYQSKRILNREPTIAEFDEFLKLIKTKKSDLVKLW